MVVPRQGNTSKSWHLPPLSVLTCLYPIESMPKNPAELVERQRDMEEKVYRIWTVLSAFEGRFHRVCACFFCYSGIKTRDVVVNDVE